MAERKPKPKPPIEEPKPSEPGVPTEAPVPKEIMQQAKKIAERWVEANRGGAPISPEFIAAALQQGLNPKEVKAILRSQALGGPRTSANYSSPELLDYFTANPDEIPGLLEAVRSVADAPATYAEYFAAGGEPGAPGTGSANAYRGGYVTGRKLKHYMQGGPAVGLTGKNPPGPDDGQAYLDEGEFVMPEHAVRYHGLKKMMMMLREAEENEDTDASMMREHQEDKAMGRPMKDVTPGAGMKGMMGMGKGMFRGGPIRRSNLAIPQVPYGARPGGRVTPERNPVRPSVPGTQDMMRPDVHNDPAEMANAGPMNVNQRFVLDPRTGMMFDMLTGQPVATR